MVAPTRNRKTIGRLEGFFAPGDFHGAGKDGLVRLRVAHRGMRTAVRMPGGEKSHPGKGLREAGIRTGVRCPRPRPDACRHPQAVPPDQAPKGAWSGSRVL